MTRVEVKPNLHVVVGGGPNSAFLVTDAGVVVVGAKEDPRAGEELRAVIAGITNRPVRFVIHPNHQARHTHGSTAFPPTVEIIAHERARNRLLAPPEAAYWTGPAASSLPNRTLDGRLTLYLGGTRVQILHPGKGHTDGDLVVLFPDQRALYTGDLFWNRRLPFIDKQHGGGANALLATMQRLARLSEAELLIPGYGDVGARADLQAQVRLLLDLQSKVRSARARGRTLAQIRREIEIPVIARSDPRRFEILLGELYNDLRPTPTPTPTRAPTRKPGQRK